MRLTAVIVLLLGFATTSIFAAPDLQDEYLEDISTRDYEDMILEEARDGLDIDFDDIYSRDIEGEEEAFAMAMRDTFDHDDFETRDYLDDLEELDARFDFDDELESFERDLEDEFEERDLDDEFDLEAREFEEDTV